jgi:regulator of sigma E protease
MQGLIMAAQLITGISILVILHELGHFWAARAFGIKVEKFYLFFDAWGFKLFSIKIGETEYGIGWLPLGGYVKIAGMVDESMDTEQLAKPAEPWEFRSKPAWQRLIVMIGGVVMNIIAAIVIFAMISFAYGEKYTLNSSVKYGIVPSEFAQEIGFQKGDKLISVNNKPIVHFEEAVSSDEIMGTNNAVYLVERNGERMNIPLPENFITKFSEQGKTNFFMPRMTFTVAETTPNYNAEKAGLLKADKIIAVDSVSFVFFDEFQQLLKQKTGTQTMFTVLRNGDTIKLPIEVDGDGKVGFVPQAMEFDYDSIQYGFFQSFPIGVNRASETISMQIKGWGKIFSGAIPANKAVQGPIGIAKFYGGEWIWSRVWLITALISLGLAFMNILPIPALDGGHVVLLLLEMITGKALSVKAMERIQTVGMVLLLTLTVFIFGNDIIGLFVK